MLGVGAMAIITGIIWLLPNHMSDVSEADGKAKRTSNDSSVNLNGIVLAMAYGVSITVMFLLGSTMYSYFCVIRYPRSVPYAWSYLAYGSPLIVGVAAIILALWRRFRGRRSRSANIRISERALQLAAYGVMAYALTAALFGGFDNEFANNWWRPPPEGIVIASVALGLIIPGSLMIALVHAKPALHQRSTTYQPTTDTITTVNAFRPRHARQMDGNTRLQNNGAALEPRTQILGPEANGAGHELTQ
jgi:hypothetical protein